MRGRKPDLEPEVEKQQSTLDITEEDYSALLSALKQQAMSGDAVARRQLIELHNANKAAKAMDFLLEITPFDIPDKKLSDIIQQADVPVVMEILNGLYDRLRIDGFSPECQGTLTALQRLFTDEAERIYAPPEEDQ